MGYLLDTNVISETIKKQPDQNVRNWLHHASDDSLYISVLTVGEIRKDVEKHSDSARRETLRLWLDSKLTGWFQDKLLHVDVKIAECWGRTLGEIKHPRPVIDSLLAATAIHHDLTLVTRNTKDFQYPNLKVFNPWHFS